MLADGPSTDEILELSSPIEDQAEAVRKMIQENYWAAMPLWSPEYATEIIELFDSHLVNMRVSTFGDTLWRAYSAYHLMDADSDTNGHAPITTVQLAGEQGELLSMEMPHFRQLVLHKKNLVAGDRLAFTPQAATADGSAMEQVSTARHLIDYAIDQRGLGKAGRDSVETAIVGGASFIHLGWDTYAGDPTGKQNPVTGNPVYTGDLKVDVVAPWDVVHEPVSQFKDARWFVVRLFENRYELAAQLLDRGDSETAEKLLEQSYSDADFQFSDPVEGWSSDIIPVYYLYYSKSPVVPNGRMSKVTGDGLLLQDGPLPYPTAPVYRNCPNEFLGTSLPFANSWGWLALQEMLNSVMTPMISRVDAFGSPMVSVPEGADWGTMGAFQVHERREGEEAVQLIDLAQMPQALPATYQLLLSELERLSGINSVVQGSPQDNVSSGTMAALIHAQALTFANDDVEQFVSVMEQVAMGALQIYQSRASEGMIITVAGKEGEPSVREFKKDSIKKIKRVTVKRSNPIMRTTAAKQDAANVMLANGLIKTPEEYLSTVETGTYSSLFTDATKQMALIREENALILSGVAPKVGSFENYFLHAKEHAALEDHYVKEENPAALRALQQHMAETFEAWLKASMKNPGRLQALGIPVLPPPPQVQAMMQQQGVEAVEGGGQPEAPNKPGPKAPQTPGVDNKAKVAQEPNIPEPAEPAQPKQG